MPASVESGKGPYSVLEKHYNHKLLSVLILLLRTHLGKKKVTQMKFNLRNSVELFLIKNSFRKKKVIEMPLISEIYKYLKSQFS